MVDLSTHKSNLIYIQLLDYINNATGIIQDMHTPPPPFAISNRLGIFILPHQLRKNSVNRGTWMDGTIAVIASHFFAKYPQKFRPAAIICWWMS